MTCATAIRSWRATGACLAEAGAQYGEMKHFNWLAHVNDGLTIAGLSLFGGIVFGGAFGWAVGLSVAAGVVLIFMGVSRAVAAIRRKALHSRVPQRSVVQRRFPGRR